MTFVLFIYFYLLLFFLVFSNEPQHGFSRVKVDSMNAQMKRVFEKMVKKRGLRRTG